MSPEQVRGESVDQGTDIFSLGLVLYEMATGRRAFEGATTSVIAAAILNSEPVPPGTLRRDLPPALEALVLKALEKDRHLRDQSVAELRVDLERLRTRTSAATRQPTEAAKTPDRNIGTTSEGAAGRKRLVVFAVTAGALLLFAAGGISFWFGAGRRTTTLEAPQVNADIQRLTLTGDAAFGSISPDGRFVAYGREKAGLWVRQLSTDSDVQVVPFLRDRRYVALTITPDGNFADFVAIEIEAGSSDLWRVPLLGGPARRLVRDVWSATGWSPDGRFMAFVRSKGWDKDSSVIVVDSAGENERIVATRHSPQSFLSAAVSAVYANRPSWSPDGTTIVLAGFSQRRGDSGPTESELVMLDAVTGSVQRVELGGKSLIEVAWLDHDRLLVNGGHTWMPTLFTSDRLAAEWRPMTQEFALFAIPTLTQDRSTLAVTRFERRSAVWVLEQSGTSLTVAVPEAAWGAGRPVLTRSGSLFYSVMLMKGLSVTKPR